MIKQMVTVVCMAAFLFAVSAIAVSADELVVGETADYGSDGELTYETDDPSVLRVGAGGLVRGESVGKTTLHIKEKKFLRSVSVKDIDITVVNGGALTVSPLEDIYFAPVMVLYDKDKKQLQKFSPKEVVYLPAGVYFIREKTKYSSFSNDYQKVEIENGGEVALTTAFTNTTTLTFTTKDKSIDGKTVEVWKQTPDGYKACEKLVFNNGKTKTVDIRSGTYCWTGDGIVSQNATPINVNGKDGYSFGIGENPLTVEVSTTEKATAVENISLSENTTENMKKVYEKLMAAGGNEMTACAIIGNMYGESGVRTSAVENGGGGHGLCQWTGGRWQKLKAYADSVGKEWTDMDVQIDFLIGELNDMNMDSFWNAKTIEEATEIFMRKFERPAESVYATSLPKRIGAAIRAYEMCGKNN